MTRARKAEAIGALFVLVGVIAMVGGSVWGMDSFLLGLVIFVVGRFL